LLDEQVGGDYDTVVYDAVAHQLYLADGQGCVVPHASEPACIGSGAEFLRGFVAAVGSVDAETLQRAIEACATRDLSVSRESSVTCVPRVARASVKRSRARRSARRRA
jgi:phage FluMu protein gp41